MSHSSLSALKAEALSEITNKVSPHPLKEKKASEVVKEFSKKIEQVWSLSIPENHLIAFNNLDLTTTQEQSEKRELSTLESPTFKLKYRSILVDWLISVHLKFKLEEASLHLAIKLLDNFLLENVHTSKSELQVIGCAALLIASKLEDVYPPLLKNFVYISADSFTSKELVEKEALICTTLTFKLIPTTRLTLAEHVLAIGISETMKFYKTEDFLNKNSVSGISNQKTLYYITWFFLEVSLVNSVLADKNDLQMALSCVFCAIDCLNTNKEKIEEKEPKTPTKKRYSFLRKKSVLNNVTNNSKETINIKKAKFDGLDDKKKFLKSAIFNYISKSSEVSCRFPILGKNSVLEDIEKKLCFFKKDLLVSVNEMKGLKGVFNKYKKKYYGEVLKDVCTVNF